MSFDPSTLGAPAFAKDGTMPPVALTPTSVPVAPVSRSVQDDTRMSSSDQDQAALPRVELPNRQAPVALETSAMHNERKARLATSVTDKIQAICAILLVIITGLYTNFTRNQNQLAAADQRPWIEIKNIAIVKKDHGHNALTYYNPLPEDKHHPKEPHLTVSVSVQNVGRSIAREINVNAELYSTEFAGVDWYNNVAEEQARFCKSSAGAEPDESSGHTLFPGESFTNTGEPTADVRLRMTVGDNAIALFLCVAYVGDLDSLYQTQTASSLYEVDSAGGSPSITIERDLDSNPPNISMSKETSHDVAR